MKKSVICISVLLALCMLASCTINSFAMNTGFSTELLPNDDKNTFLTNVNITVLTEEPKRGPIDCFDINGNGLIALGFGKSDKKQYVYMMKAALNTDMSSVAAAHSVLNGMKIT